MKNVVEIIALVYAILYYHPELRIGQILVTAAHKAGWKNDDIFYCDNTCLKDGLEIYLKEVERNIKNDCKGIFDEKDTSKRTLCNQK